MIYHPAINYFLRNIYKPIGKLLPSTLRIPPSGKIQLKFKNYRAPYFTNQTSYLTQLVFWNGMKNFEYSEIFFDLVLKISSFWDVGANTGYYSVIAGVLNKEIKIHSFEPASGPFHYLKKNVQLNNLNVKTESLALSDSNGDQYFYEIRNKKYTYLKYNLGGEGNTGSKTEGRNFEKIKVLGIQGDNYFKRENLKSLDLIKIDTEGTEHLILKNCDYILSNFQPIVICETLFGKIESELETLMKKYGYHFYNHTPLGLKKVDTLIRKEDDGIRNCFFVHPSKSGLIESYVCS